MGDNDQQVRGVLIALGSNLGDRANLLSEACRRLAEHPEVKDLNFSSWHPTSPVGGPSQAEFLNGAACFRTMLCPSGVFSLLQETERELGRETVERWGPRQIDLDLLLYADDVIDEDGIDLIVPHPRMAFRSFVLRPANEVVPQMRHPVIGWTIADLWRHLQDCPPYVVFALGDHQRSQRLAQRLAVAIDVQRVGVPEFSAFAMPTGVTAEALWCSRDATEPKDCPNRPKIVVTDAVVNGNMSGPTIDVSGLSDEESEIEIAAAIDAMRE